MLIQVDFEMAFQFAESTPIVLLTFLHPSRDQAVRNPERFSIEPHVPVARFLDCYGNRCGRAVVPSGTVVFRHDAVLEDCGLPDLQDFGAPQARVQDLPDSVLMYLLPSRYCEVDSDLKDLSWTLFRDVQPGWPRVQAVCDFTFRHIHFDYQQACPSRTARETFRERVGVCRDYTHLAITLCRCLNIPARYCTGYLGDIGIPRQPGPMDFSAWLEVFLGDQWYTFDARNNIPRIGRVLMARGRDAADVAIMTSFGVSQLQVFRVGTEEVSLS